MARNRGLSCGIIGHDDSRNAACPLMLYFLFNYRFFLWLMWYSRLSFFSRNDDYPSRICWQLTVQWFSFSLFSWTGNCSKFFSEITAAKSGIPNSNHYLNSISIVFSRSNVFSGALWEPRVLASLVWHMETRRGLAHSGQVLSELYFISWLPVSSTPYLVRGLGWSLYRNTIPTLFLSLNIMIRISPAYSRNKTLFILMPFCPSQNRSSPYLKKCTESFLTRCLHLCFL